MATILGIAGSLRAASYNAALLRAAAELSPAGTRIEIGSIAGIPPYDDDELERGLPEPVRQLKDRLAAADGLLLVTPEYNHSVPGVLKNAVDWLSRPANDIPRVFGNKPVAMIGASAGPGGTRFAQAAWLPVLHNLGTRLWCGKQLYVASAASTFDEQLKLTDTRTRQGLTTFLAAFAAFIGER